MQVLSSLLLLPFLSLPKSSASVTPYPTHHRSQSPPCLSSKPKEHPQLMSNSIVRHNDTNFSTEHRVRGKTDELMQNSCFAKSQEKFALG